MTSFLKEVFIRFNCHLIKILQLNTSTMYSTTGSSCIFCLLLVLVLYSSVSSLSGALYLFSGGPHQGRPSGGDRPIGTGRPIWESN